MPKKIITFFLLTFLLLGLDIVAQQAPVQPNEDNVQILTGEELPALDYAHPKKYIIEEITISGANNYEDYILVSYSGLKKGQKITVPGDDLTSVVNRFWDQGMFSNVKVEIVSIRKNKIWINIHLDQRPKISNINFSGTKKSEKEDLEKGMDLSVGNQLTPYLIDKTERYITRYYRDKGYYYVDVNIVPKEDLKKSTSTVNINVKKGHRTKVNELVVEGNKALTSRTIDRSMKKTNDASNILNIFRSKKFIPDEFENDKQLLIAKYNEHGYRDARILFDSIYPSPDKKKRVDVLVRVDEGQQYHFRNINLIGNTVYTTAFLRRVLDIQRGDIYNQQKLNKRLNEDEDCISNLYLDNGYLFFNLNAVETNIYNDSIDLEIRIVEGKQATINRVMIEGSDYLYEHVVRRELRTKPGDLFSKTDIMRSMRELAASGHFATDPGLMDIKTDPDPENGTVDLTYVLQSKRNDQIELSAGWGQTGVVGILSLKFTNFSLRNIFNFKSYRPLPQGDGQTLSIRAQTNGMYYQSYGLSFLEPWLGGKRPNSLSFSFNYSVQNGVSGAYSNSYYENQQYLGNSSTSSSSQNSWFSSSYDPDKYIKTLAVSLGFGTRLNWPDDYFTLYGQVSYQNYNLSKWDYFAFETGRANNLNFSLTLARNSLNQPIYPSSGTDMSLYLATTLPYSLWDGVDYETAPDDIKYKWIEYYKIKFKTKLFFPLTPDNKLVIMGRAEFGFLGYFNYNKRSPFETFYMGGDGMTGYSSTYATETIAMRGYSNGSLTTYNSDGSIAGNIYTRLSMELRYPLVMKENTMVWALAFVEAGNCWKDYYNFNPFELKRAAGVGLRVYMPMFGLLGVDWAYGFDSPNNGSTAVSGSQFHFIIGQEF